jgi:hypothetical protein
MTEGLKDRPALLRRTPRPAPDEKVDPVDYSPAVVAPAVSVPAAAPAQAPTAESEVEPAATAAQRAGGVVAPEPVQAQPAPAPQTVEAAPAAAKPKQAPRTPKATKPTSRKANRREITFPLSTRISEEVSEILYSTAEEQDMSVREVIEQAIKARWGQN